MPRDQGRRKDSRKGDGNRDRDRDRDRDRGHGRRDSRDRDRRKGDRDRGYDAGDRRDRDRRNNSGKRKDDHSRSRRRQGGDGRKGRKGRSEDDRRRRRRSPESESESEYGGSDSESSSGGKKSGDSDKDEIVHFAWQRGIVMEDRYKVVKLLGDGTFGRVLLCTDQREEKKVAIKVIRDVKRYAENAKIEADILKDIRKADPKGEASRSCIMHDTFMYKRHYCLVFDPCGASLYDFLKQNSFRGFWMQDIQSFAKQSLEALQFLHGRLQMTHTDLKPENILLEVLDPPRESDFPREAAWQENQRKSSSKKNSNGPYMRPVSSQIRLIDFGNATYEDEHHSSIINTRQYRGPEVVLSSGWNELSDVWSMGCIFMELYTGELLFGTHENLEHLALMEKACGRLPEKMLKHSKEAKYVFQDRSGSARLNWPEGAQGASSEKHVQSQLPLSEMTPPEHAVFSSFVGHLLVHDKEVRPSAKEALRHQFLSATFTD